MNLDHHWIALARIEVIRVEKPALSMKIPVLPLDVIGLSPMWLLVVVRVSELAPIANGAAPNFRRLLPRRTDDRTCPAVAGESEIGEVAILMDAFVAFPK